MCNNFLMIVEYEAAYRELLTLNFAVNDTK